MNIVIIEDENIAARRLERIIVELGFTVTKKLSSVKKSIAWFETKQNTDLIFLDIHLSDGLSFEIFEKVDINAHIIFTTAYDKYAIKAFKLKSIDYLLKPIDKNELITAIDKYKACIKNTFTPSINNEQIELIQNLLYKNKKEYKKRFLVKKGCHIHSIEINNIKCFYSENKASYIYDNESRSYIIDLSLDEIEHLVDNKIFFRINRKSIININFINDIIMYSNSRLKIKIDNLKLEDMIVSREKVKEFKNLLD